MSSFGAVTAKTKSGSVPLDVREADPGASVSAQLSMFESTTIDLSGLRDVLGGPLGLGAISVKVPTSVVTDLGFATPLPAGSSIGSTPSVAGGLLRVATQLGQASGWSFAMAIGASSGKTRLRARHRLACGSAPSIAVDVRIVSAEGGFVVIKPACVASPVDETVTLVGAGPYVLVAIAPRFERVPCNYPFGGPSASYELDELAFE